VRNFSRKPFCNRSFAAGHSSWQASASSSKVRQERPEGKTNGPGNGLAPIATGPPLRECPGRTAPSLKQYAASSGLTREHLVHFWDMAGSEELLVVRC
jgi:hypothetical protein